MYKVFGGCSLKEKRKGNNAQKQQIENRTCKQLKIRQSSFPRQSLTHAQILFSSVGRYLIFLGINKCNKVRKMALDVDSPLESPPIAVFRGLRFIYW